MHYHSSVFVGLVNSVWSAIFLCRTCSFGSINRPGLPGSIAHGFPFLYNRACFLGGAGYSFFFFDNGSFFITGDFD
jgi:hypothetical protein